MSEIFKLLYGDDGDMSKKFKSEEYEKVRAESILQERNFIKTLSDEQKKGFNTCCEACCEKHVLEHDILYARGFSRAVKLIIEALSNKD